MNIFKKYPSIENRYQTKFIMHFVDQHPNIKDSRFIIYEKLHGSNISLVFYDGEFNICSRNRIIKKTENFNMCWEVVKQYSEFVDFWKKKSTDGKKYTFFGEIVGDGIQKGVKYHNERKIYLFDLMVNDILQTQNTFFHFLSYNDNYNLCPIIKNDVSFDDMINFPNEFNSTILNEENNVCEGIVIKPFDRVFICGGNHFLLKSKNEKFSEKTKEKKVVKDENREMDESVLKMKLEFDRYINENRVNNIFSREGIIQNNKEIGKFIKLILKDAQEDFLKDNDISSFTSKEMKFIFNCSKEIVEILRKYM